MEKTIKKEMKGELKKIVMAFLSPVFFTIITDVMYVFANYKLPFLVTTTSTFFLECLIIYLFFFVFLGITKKTSRATLITGIILLIINCINQIKIAFTGEPVFLTDVLYLGSSDELIGIVQGSFWNTISQYIGCGLMELNLFIACIILAYRNNIDIKVKKINISLIIVPIIIISILFAPIQGLNRFIINNFFEIGKRKDYRANTTNMVYYLSYGVITGMYGQLLENRIQKPVEYNETILNKELENARSKDNENFLGTPNIIVVFSESFWDIGQLGDEIKFNKEVAPNFNKLKGEGLFFDMISPVYGGISANVEFEFLTGANTMYYNNGYVPYMQLYRNNKYYNNPSIIRELKNNNYKTKIVTTASPRLFDCGRFYKYIDVDETEYLTNVKEADKKGKYISDETLTNKIIEEFNSKEKDKKMFYMTMTMQNHMPYTSSKYQNYDIDIVESSLSDKLNETIKAYAQGVYDSDKELGKLYEYIKSYSEPTIIVFYGDHLPYLTNGKEDALKQLKYFNTNDQDLNSFRKYNTQSLILANFDLKKEDEIKYLGPDLLGCYILNNMDIELSDYYKWLYNTKEYISASNHSVLVDSEGKKYNIKNMDENMKKMYKLRECMQYKLFVR